MLCFMIVNICDLNETKYILCWKYLIDSCYMIHTKNKIKKTASKRTGENGQAKKNSGERGHVVV